MTVSGIEDLVRSTTCKKVVIVAPGPTLASLNSLEEYDLAIFVGDSFRRSKLRAKNNWLVRANTEYPKLDDVEHLSHLSEFEGTLVFASSVLESEKSVAWLLNQAFSERANFVFDQRHFHGLSCNPSQTCCQFRRSPTIQELLAEKLGWSHHYSEGVTVLSHALALALMVNEIESVHIYGADLPLKASSYVYAKAKQINEVKVTSPLARTATAFEIGPRRAYRVVTEKLALRLLGAKAPSVFALDFLPLLSDFQYLSDAAASLEIQIRVFGKNSTLLSLSGYGSLE
jgi:hypothetical protein